MDDANQLDVVVRSARAADVPVILGFIHELAEYERLALEVEATLESLHAALFGPCPVAEALLAELAGQPVGYALFFTNYSTFVGRAGIYLEDLYVQTAARGRGVGRRLLAHVAQLAVERQCGRLEWSALDWNTPAIEFYQNLGARPLSDWTM